MPRQLERPSARLSAHAGRTSAAAQTMDSSAAVRVMEKKGPRMASRERSSRLQPADGQALIQEREGKLGVSFAWVGIADFPQVEQARVFQIDGPAGRLFEAMRSSRATT